MHAANVPNPSTQLRNAPDFNTAPVTGPLLNLEPQAVWHRFAALLEMPRPSEKEHQVRAALIQFAVAHNLTVQTDPVGNLSIQVPGRGAGKDAPRLAVQAHMDMVGTCADGVVHDFEKDPIRARLSAQDIRGVSTPVIAAQGTTLGADNGIGLCMALALVDDPALMDAPPLELVFTVDEEQGLKGAKGIAPELVTAPRLLNLDTEEEGEIYISCAGSMDIPASLPIKRSERSAGSGSVRLGIGELPGGHSGVEIHSERVNPLKVLPVFVERFVSSGMNLQIAAIEGGNARNAIPKKLEVLFVFPADEEQTLIEKAQSVWAECAWELFPNSAALGKVSVSSRLGDDLLAPLSKESQDDLLAALSTLPHGVIAWSQAVPGLVETSNNVARITSGEDSISVECMARSSNPASLAELVGRASAIFKAQGFTVQTANESPGWAAEPDSDLLKRTAAAYREVLGVDPEIKAVHAGLECGAFKRINPNLQMVSFGPDIGGAHTPEEYVSIPSVSNVYRVLQETVRQLATVSA